jgi:endoglucanase
MKQFFREILIMVFALFMACSSENKGPIQPDKPDTAHFLWLHTRENKIVDETGEVRILRGVNRSGFDYDKTGAGICEKEIAYICSQWKAQIIRLPFNQDWIMRDPAYRAFLEVIIGWINNNGAYALLDLQWRNTTDKIPPIPDEEAVSMWRMLAEKYKDNPAVLYDIHNEAHDTSWEAWRERAGQIIEAIQSVHPRALIFVSGLDWAYDLRGWGEKPLPYANIVYSSHPYPFKAEPWAWAKYFGNVADKYPVFIGEFGGESSHLQWGKELIAYLDENNLGWTAWSWSNYTYLTEDDRRTPTEFGQLVQNALLKHAGQLLTTALALVDLRVDYLGNDRATIIWNTSSESDGKVRYGKTSAYTDSIYAMAKLKVHLIKVTNLEPGTLYHFQVVSVDRYDSRASTQDSTFTTLP